MNGYKLIYHDKESSTRGVSPFDKAVTEIIKNRDISIVCPYIGIDYFDRIIRLANTFVGRIQINKYSRFREVCIIN